MSPPDAPLSESIEDPRQDSAATRRKLRWSPLAWAALPGFFIGFVVGSGIARDPGEMQPTKPAQAQMAPAVSPDTARRTADSDVESELGTSRGPTRASEQARLEAMDPGPWLAAYGELAESGTPSD